MLYSHPLLKGGGFDIVQHFGLFYHLRDPMLSLAQTRSVMKDGGTLLLETAFLPDDESCVARFNFGPGAFYSDYTSWWAATLSCLREMLRLNLFEMDDSSVSVLADPTSVAHRICVKAVARAPRNEIDEHYNLDPSRAHGFGSHLISRLPLLDPEAVGAYLKDRTKVPKSLAVPPPVKVPLEEVAPAPEPGPLEQDSPAPPAWTREGRPLGPGEWRSNPSQGHHALLAPPEIAACLEPGEEIRWQGRPRPYVFILRGLPAIFFGATWSILGAFWYHGSGGLTQTPFEGWWRILPIVPLPFIVVGWSFFFYPINLGARARHTWYLVTNRRVLTARWHSTRPVEVRVFSRAAMGAPQVIKRFDGLDEVILLRAAQDRPFLVPPLESGFFGIPTATPAAAAIRLLL